MIQIIALFGPPGVGKSTLVQLAREKEFKTVDLEDVADNRAARGEYIKHNLVGTTYKMIVGAADTEPEDYPPGTLSVLLLPPKEEFLKRSMERDRLAPHKRGQNASEIYDDFLNWQRIYDVVFTDIGTPEQTLNSILDLL